MKITIETSPDEITEISPGVAKQAIEKLLRLAEEMDYMDYSKIKDEISTIETLIKFY